MKRMQRVFGDLDALRYADNRLDGERRAAFIHHLAEDPAEAQRVATWRRQNEALRAAFAGVLDEAVPVALRLAPAIPAGPARPRPVLRALEGMVPLQAETPASRLVPASPADAGAASSHEAPVRWPRAALRMPAGALSLITAAALIVVLVHALLPGRAPFGASAAQGSALASRADDAYMTYAVDPSHPVEFPAVQVGTFDRWVERRLGIAVAPADLHADGWTLLGGRLVPGTGGAAALYIYEDSAGERLSLMVERATRGETSAAGQLDDGREGGATMAWTRGDLAYALSVGRSRDWLSRNGQALRSRVDGGTAG